MNKAKLSPQKAINHIQEAIDELWKIERALEQDGLATPETIECVLAMDALFSKEQNRWANKLDGDNDV